MANQILIPWQGIQYKGNFFSAKVEDLRGKLTKEEREKILDEINS